jgi:SAM-dependent methyltransferase
MSAARLGGRRTRPAPPEAGCLEGGHGAHHWDAVGQAWEDAHPQRLWRAHSDVVNHALFARWLPATPVGRLLKTDLFDEAVSPGIYPLLESRARAVVGIDVALVIVRHARARWPGLHAGCADVRSLPFADGTFDVVVSNSTLDHFDALGDVETSLREIHRVLRDGGRLLLTMDNPLNPMITLRNALPRRLLQRLGLVPYYVGVTCAPSRLVRLLTAVGFEVREVGAAMHCWRVLAVALARVAERYGNPALQSRYLRLLGRCEALSTGPLRFVTGHFITVHAGKTPAGTVDARPPRA